MNAAESPQRSAPRPSPGRGEQPDGAEDVRLFCQRCWRPEFHFLAVKSRGRHAYRWWRNWTFGLIDLSGPFRCRCCGQHRWGRFDLFRSSRARRIPPAAPGDPQANERP